jgi:hypothetical protein
MSATTAAALGIQIIHQSSAESGANTGAGQQKQPFCHDRIPFVIGPIHEARCGTVDII